MTVVPFAGYDGDGSKGYTGENMQAWFDEVEGRYDGTSLVQTSLRLLITLLVALAAWVVTAKLIKHPILAELLSVVASAARIVKLRY